MIKQIIFDIGGVLLDLDTNRTEEKFRHLYGSDPDVYAEIQAICLQYEVGAFSEGSFLHRLQRLSTNVITERQLVDTYNAMLGPMSTCTLGMFSSLSKKYGLYVLSNTNQTHLQFFNSYLKKEHAILDFGDTYFIKAYYSHKINRRKPDIATYEFVIEDANIIPEETLFIDDNHVNIEEAKKVGLRAQLHDPQNPIVEMIEAYIQQN